MCFVSAMLNYTLESMKCFFNSPRILLKPLFNQVWRKLLFFKKKKKPVPLQLPDSLFYLCLSSASTNRLCLCCSVLKRQHSTHSWQDVWAPHLTVQKCVGVSVYDQPVLHQPYQTTLFSVWLSLSLLLACFLSTWFPFIWIISQWTELGFVLLRTCLPSVPGNNNKVLFLTHLHCCVPLLGSISTCDIVTSAISVQICFASLIQKLEQSIKHINKGKLSAFINLNCPDGLMSFADLPPLL